MIDFRKITFGNTANTILHPRDIFNALPNKDATKFQYPRDVQSQVWSKWFKKRDEKNLVIKMNTGSGKTVVGLLILKSCLNEGRYPGVYVCPDSYLVDQVINAANELGITVTKDASSVDFLSGNAILVINIHKLVNGKSVFGIGEEGCKIKISSIVIDDAHSCIEIIDDKFTIKIPVQSSAYENIWNVFYPTMKLQNEAKTLEIQSGDPSIDFLIPYWVWQSNISKIIKILLNNSNEEYLKFVWPLLKDSLKLCNCVINAKEIEISPIFTPIHVIPSLNEADRKIFMTATLLDDSVLSTHFGVYKSEINTAIVPDSAGDVGDRMILLPQAINSEIDENNIKTYCKEASRNFNVVVIVPSHSRAKFWQGVADEVLYSSNMYEGIKQLKSRANGLTILVNRYDGIDLPADSCRMLVIDGLPDVRRRIDKMEQFFLMGADRSFNKIIQRIEQGMGRGVRSNDDYCVVLLTGRNLTSTLYSRGGVDKFSPATKAQFNLSAQIADQIKGKNLKEFHETLNLCLKRDETWVSVSKGTLASLQYNTTVNADEISLAFRQAYDYALNDNFTKSVDVLQTLVNTTTDKKIRGYIKQCMSLYMNLYDQPHSQQLQLSALNDNRSLLKPIEGIDYHKFNDDAFDQAERCSRYLSENYNDPNKLLIDLNCFFENLRFMDDSYKIFEENLKKLALYIGLNSQRPELETGKGPDVLWKLDNNNFLVIECKNEATQQTISKHYCNQLNGSCIWFETTYGTSYGYTPILVHHSVIFDYDASPKPNTRIMDGEMLDSLLNSFGGFIRVIAHNNYLGNAPKIRNALISYKLRGQDIVNNYTKKYSMSPQ